MIAIDGSFGEGGGQILRTSLALSMCTGKPFQITNIRAGRKKPGLMRQHLTAVNAAQTICNADVAGAQISSQTLEFVPDRVRPGNHHFSVGTAGSSTLVLQTILPPLLLEKKPSTIVVEGGTHGSGAPPFHFTNEAFFPLLEKMGAKCAGKLLRWGFFPAGGGKFEVTISPPPEKLEIVEIINRGNLVRSEVLTAVAKVPLDIAEDEANMIVNSLGFPVDRARAEEAPSPGPGNVAMLKLDFENCTAFFSGFGSLGVSRKKVAREVINDAIYFYKSTAAIDQHLADQILIPMALARGGRFTSIKPTKHTLTNIEIIKRFLDVSVICSKKDHGSWQIEVST